MKVSILVPIYGVEKFIGQCAQSLFSQTYKDIEYIFVNDCTPDNSIQVLEEVLAKFPERQQQVSIIQHEKNRGLGAARMTGLQLATGELMMIVDSDDYIAIDCVEKLVARQVETGADIVDGAYATFTGDKIMTTTAPWAQLSTDKYLKAILIQNTVTNHVWARIYRRAIFEETGIGFVEGVNLAEDYAIMGRILLKASRVCLNEVVYYYRYNDYGTFAEGVSARHIMSVVRAAGIVCDYLRHNDQKGTYYTAMDIGLLNIYSIAAKVGVNRQEVQQYCGKPSSPLFRCCLPLATIMHGRPLRWLYLFVKRLYKMSMLHIN